MLREFVYRGYLPRFEEAICIYIYIYISKLRLHKSHPNEPYADELYLDSSRSDTLYVEMHTINLKSINKTMHSLQIHIMVYITCIRYVVKQYLHIVYSNEAYLNSPYIFQTGHTQRDGTSVCHMWMS